MPAGKAEFDGELVDVIADGLPIDRGTSIVVTRRAATACWCDQPMRERNPLHSSAFRCFRQIVAAFWPNPL